MTVYTALPSTVSTMEHVCPVRCIVMTIIEATCCLCFQMPLGKESLRPLKEQPIVRFPCQSWPERNVPDLRQLQIEAIQEDIAMVWQGTQHTYEEPEAPFQPARRPSPFKGNICNLWFA